MNDDDTTSNERRIYETIKKVLVTKIRIYVL